MHAHLAIVVDLHHGLDALDRRIGLGRQLHGLRIDLLLRARITDAVPFGHGRKGSLLVVPDQRERIDRRPDEARGRLAIVRQPTLQRVESGARHRELVDAGVDQIPVALVDRLADRDLVGREGIDPAALDQLAAHAARHQRDVAHGIEAHFASPQDQHIVAERSDAREVDPLALEVLGPRDVRAAHDVEARHRIGGGEHDALWRARTRRHPHYRWAAAANVDVADAGTDKFLGDDNAGALAYQLGRARRDVLFGVEAVAPVDGGFRRHHERQLGERDVAQLDADRKQLRLRGRRCASGDGNPDQRVGERAPHALPPVNKPIWSRGRQRIGTQPNTDKYLQAWNQIALASFDVVNDILLRMNAILSSILRPTHATLGGYVHWSQEQS